MKLSKANLLVVKLAGSDKRDQVLHQVHIASDGTTVASNGHALMAVEPIESPERPPVVTLPDFQEEDEITIPPEGIGAPVHLIEKTLKNLPRGVMGNDLGYAILTKLGGPRNSIELTTTNMVSHEKVEGGLVRKRFPAWRGMLQDANQACGSGRVCVDRKALIKLLQALEAACPGPDNATFIEFGSGMNDGLILRNASVENGQHAIGYLTPMDTGGEWLEMNAWEKRVFAKVRHRRRRKDADER